MIFSKITYPEAPVVITETLGVGEVTDPKGQVKKFELCRSATNPKFLFIRIQDKGLYAIDILSIISDIYHFDKTNEQPPELVSNVKKFITEKVQETLKDEDQSMHDSQERSEDGKRSNKIGFTSD